MPNGENVVDESERPGDILNPGGLVLVVLDLGNIAELDKEVENVAGGDAAKRGGGGDIV